jgi:hypothetical protein
MLPGPPNRNNTQSGGEQPRSRPTDSWNTNVPQLPAGSDTGALPCSQSLPLRGLEAHATIAPHGAAGILPVALASSWCSGHPAHCQAAPARAGSPRHPSRAAKDRTPATPDIGDTRDGRRASAEEVPRNARGGANHRQKNFATRRTGSSTLLTVANRRQPPRSQAIPERGSFATISGRGPMNSAPAAPRIGGLDRRRSQGVSRSRYPSWARTTTPGRATRTLTRCQRPSPRRLDG